MRATFATLSIAVLAMAYAGPTVHATGDRDLRVFGLTDDGRLVRFRAGAPRMERDFGYVSNLMGADTALIGIDFRVQDGKLYGVGNGGGVYTIDTTTARATFVNALTVPLSGTSFGVDFNPAADRLRIISDAGQNLAHNVNAGGVTAANGTLTYTPPPAAPVSATGVTAAAYTNNDLNQPATATTLFDLDTMLDQTVIQSPPSTGILVATGQLGVDAGSPAGFDIYSRRVAGVAVANQGFASLVVNGKSGFYRINLTTGRATRLGSLDDMVVDVAIPLNQT
ncbi:MAG TPA: DUF4394 domain-containing protein [Vicinamibacterales bacterium]|jgi:hypothetical protein|nr:DUF4394 domain-containing protein [Vicinamibacterales bacterium]